MATELAVIEPDSIELRMQRKPEAVLAEARSAAQALADVISNKKKPVIFNGEQYLEFEDWQTVSRFFGITARVRESKYVDYGGNFGFEASADAVWNGQIISSADSLCMSDEPNWKGKPLFQLRSMAQTRACAKALRNVVSWVVVLAGYRPTPAEEMLGQTAIGHAEAPAKLAPTISDAQAKRLFAIAKKSGATDQDIKTVIGSYGYEHTRDILKSDYESICGKFDLPPGE